MSSQLTIRQLKDRANNNNAPNNAIVRVQCTVDEVGKFSHDAHDNSSDWIFDVFDPTQEETHIFYCHDDNLNSNFRFGQQIEVFIDLSEVTRTEHRDFFVAFDVRILEQPPGINEEVNQPLDTFEEVKQSFENNLEVSFPQNENKHNLEQLIQSIIEKSNGKEWPSVNKEWELKSIYRKEKGRCKCGHFPITQRCVIRNKFNGNELVIGNVCIKHILEAQWEIIRKIWKIFGNPEVRADQDVIEHAFSKRCIKEQEMKQYLSLQKRQDLRTSSENDFILKINLKIIEKFDAKKIKCLTNPSHKLQICYTREAKTLLYICFQCHQVVKIWKERKENLENPEDQIEEEIEGEDEDQIEEEEIQEEDEDQMEEEEKEGENEVCQMKEEKNGPKDEDGECLYQSPWDL